MSAVLKDKEVKELSIPPLAVDFKPLEISFNFDEINERLDEYLGQKISLVTEETIKDEKKLVASLRKEGEFIKSSFKQYKDKAIAPLSDAEKKIIFIVEKFKQTADAKVEQIKRIEDETRAICRGALLAERDFHWESLAITDEFMKAVIDDLIKLTSLTAKGELTKAAKQSVQERVNADLALQNKINGRLLSVENKSLRNDINPPLSRANVEAFLYADDFDERLDAIIAAEVARKAEAEERLRKKLEAEKQKAIDDALKAQQAEANRIAREAAAEAQRIAEQDRIAAHKAEMQAKSEALAIADKAKQEATQSANPAKDVEKLKEEISQLSEMNARFPEERTAAAIKEKRQELNSLQANPAPDNAVVYRIQVEYKAKHVFAFTSRPNADQTKMKAYFWAKALKDLNINDDDILSVEVL